MVQILDSGLVICNKSHTVQYSICTRTYRIVYSTVQYVCMIVCIPAVTGVVFMPRISKSLGQCARLENQ